jgi:predicted AlkP superfamily phosphohydrolase/phosphomutase
MKTLIIGIDGATFNILLPMIKKGQLPNISKMLNNGVYGDLRSIFPPITFPAWTSMKTGKNPAKHGVFDFLRGIPYTSENNCEISIADQKEKSFWKILSENNYKVGVINVPATYPPEKVNGVFISGFGTPTLNSEFTYPSQIKKEIIKNCKFEFDIIEQRKNGKEKQFIKKITKTTKKITKTILYILEKNNFDFLMINYMAVDQTQHFFYGYRDENHPLYDEKKSHYGSVIDDIYKLIDEQIGIILSKISEDTNIFLVSDHGFGPYLKSVYLNEWLEKQGLLERKIKDNKESEIKKIPKIMIEKVADKIGPGFAKYLPSALKNRANAYISWINDIDWEKTKAYSGGYPGKIYINLKGREKHGIVNHGKEYEDILKEIEIKIRELKDPVTNEKIVTEIYRKNEIYNGKYSDIAPDLMVVLKDMSYLNHVGFLKGKIFYPPLQGGDHRLNGIFIAYGPDIKNQGKKIENLSICDIAPTILQIFNVSLLKDFDGKVLKNIFKQNSEVAKRKEKYIEKTTEKDLIKQSVRKFITNKKFEKDKLNDK